MLGTDVSVSTSTNKTSDNFLVKLTQPLPDAFINSRLNFAFTETSFRVLLGKDSRTSHLELTQAYTFL